MSNEPTSITLATKITMLRILGVPVFVVLLTYYLSGVRLGNPDERYRLAALVLFLLVAATDALDGWLARRRNEISRLGSILDPIADKALMLSGLILLTKPALPQLTPHIPLWFTGLVISRDVFLVAGALLIHAYARDVKIRPHVTGKVATVLQIVVIGWALAQAAADWFLGAVFLAALFTAVSWGIYLLDGLRQLERAHPAPPSA
ncbi:MAG TPA: CDP-alcohol phosphatidyltransferase family protein [Kiritimatiellia bacterium]|nr:CDP-alcohol phosphatidyltransferase family protein [Kiritimatiellia bacterium]HMO99170.1 CDP-alcohol phosphatidyltransferase family protein [Kiritimatiellia bacterium]HMP95757.1 CDP-alcohol phosphatidyltransferase family protein [Kiritimatiellia bacterium]